MNATSTQERLRVGANPKIAGRILRTSIMAVAKKHGLDFLEAEALFAKTLTAIAHLAAHDRYPLSMKDKVDALLEAHKKLVDAANGDPRYSKEWLERLNLAANKVRDTAAFEFRAEEIRELDIQIFLAVFESAREKHIQEGWNPSAALSDKHYVLAKLIASNFEVYSRTLNT